MNVLFLDIGSYSIKTLYFQGKYKGLSLKEYLIVPTKKEDDLSRLEKITNTISEIKKNHSYYPDKTFVSFPSDKVVSKFIQVPFKDKKRIKMSLPLELEEILPFEIEDVIYDWRLIDRVGKISNIFVSVCTKTDLSMYIDAMEVCGLDTDAIIPTTDCFINILERIHNKQSKKKKKTDEISEDIDENDASIYLDLGFNKTNIFLCLDNKVKHIRTIPFGGDYVTKSIKDELCIDYKDAEELKLSEGYLNIDDQEYDNTINENKLGNIIRQSYDYIIRDINQTISYFKTNERISINKGFLLGNAWKVKNFIEYLNKELKINFEEFKYLDALDLNFKFAESSSESVMHNAVGLSLLQLDKEVKGINFRRGEFSKSKTSENVNQTLKLLKPSFIVLGVFFISFFFYSFINSLVLSEAINDYKDQINKKIKTAFFDKRPRQIEMLFENLDSFNDEIIVRLETQKTMLEGEIDDGELSSLKILNSLSASFPKNKIVDIVELHINKNIVKIVKGVVPNGSVVKDIIDGMEKSGVFEEIKQGNIRIAVDGVNKEFDLTATYKGKL